ncbi:MAG: hypothetical protein KZQ94_20890 [Candidatus Thiodiazotropha sp. (ex Troendleina suluensis)]|nr:hypothetical protein [Candidatus Thiodiazotropha sp. (ex Troendleina suluensis)]
MNLLVTAVISALGGVITWERFLDKPDTVIIHQKETTWKEFAVIGLAAAGGFYLASKVTK